MTLKSKQNKKKTCMKSRYGVNLLHGVDGSAAAVAIPFTSIDKQIVSLCFCSATCTRRYITFLKLIIALTLYSLIFQY